MTSDLAEAVTAMRLRQTVQLLDWLVHNGPDADTAARARDAVAAAEQMIRALPAGGTG